MQVSKQITGIIIALAFLIVYLAGPAHAQGPSATEKAAVKVSKQEWKVLATSPGVQVVSEQAANPGQVIGSNDQPPMDAAYDWLMEKGLEEGRNLYKGKLLYISMGAVAINARPNEPDYIDSRVLAFQRAELEAKAKTAIYLGVDLTTSRGSSEREINPKERQRLEQIYKNSEDLRTKTQKTGVSGTIQTLFEKAGRLAEAKLDQALKESGEDPQAEQQARQRRQQARQNMVDNLRNISSASLSASACAFAEVQGTQIIQSFEGSYQGNYQIAVITLWSRNLQKLVQSMQTGRAPWALPKKQAKQKILRQLPRDPAKLSCLTGVRAYINTHGEHVILGFGQAGVEVLGGRKDKAFMTAGRKARLRAMGALRSFMGETVAFQSTERLREVLALYADEYQGGGEEYASLSQFQEMIKTQAKRQKIIGVHGLFTKELTHPFTDRPLVLKVMAWSPESQALSKEVQGLIEGKQSPEQSTVQTYQKQKEQTPSREGTISSGGADADAW